VDAGIAITVDAAGNAWIAGETASPDFPTSPGAALSTYGGGRCASRGSDFRDGFIARIDAGGSRLAYATYIGGHGCEAVSAVAVAGDGSAYVTGVTESTDFPVTPDAFQRQSRRGSRGGGTGDAFVTKIDPTGSEWLYSTYLGANGNDAGHAIAVDTGGNVYVAGSTTSTDFPTLNPIQALTIPGTEPPARVPCTDTFIAMFDSQGALRFSTYLGSINSDNAESIGLDRDGNIYVAGTTKPAWYGDPSDLPLAGQQPQARRGSLFVAKIAPNAGGPVFTSASITDEAGTGAGLIPGGIAVISGTGLTSISGTLVADSDPPPTVLAGTWVTVNGTAAQILSVSNVNGQEQVRFRVPPITTAFATVVVSNGDGTALTVGVPVGVLMKKEGDGQTAVVGSLLAISVALADATGSSLAGNYVHWRVYPGGGRLESYDERTDSSGRAAATWRLGPGVGVQTVTASTPYSGGFLTFTANATAGEITPVVPSNGVTNAAGFDRSIAAISPGAIVSIFGTTLSSAPAAGVSPPFWFDPFSGDPMALFAYGTRVTFNGVPAPLFYVSPLQLNVQVPFELAGYSSAEMMVAPGDPPAKSA